MKIPPQIRSVVYIAFALVYPVYGQSADHPGATAPSRHLTPTEHHAYWTDPDTQLTWTTSDNGFGVSLSQAIRYCRELTLGGYKDWTLPAIDDLQRIFAGPANPTGQHVKGSLKLTGWQWSLTAGTQEGESWVLDFGDGGRALVAEGDSGLNRALCVRRVAP